MAQPGRLGMTEVQKSELWHRWRDGESIVDISRALSTAADNATAPLRRTKRRGSDLDAPNYAALLSMVS